MNLLCFYSNLFSWFCRIAVSEYHTVWVQNSYYSSLFTFYTKFSDFDSTYIILKLVLLCNSSLTENWWFFSLQYGPYLKKEIAVYIVCVAILWTICSADISVFRCHKLMWLYQYQTRKICGLGSWALPQLTMKRTPCITWFRYYIVDITMVRSSLWEWGSWIF